MAALPLTMPEAYLSDAELAHICAPLTQPAAQVRHLRRMGFHVLCRPNGRPLVSRGNYEQVTGASTPLPAAQAAAESPQPDRAALLRLVRAGVQSAA